MAILDEHRDKLEAVANALLERETLEREEFETLMAGGEELPLPEPEQDQIGDVTEQAVAAYKEEVPENSVNSGGIRGGRNPSSERLRGG